MALRVARYSGPANDQRVVAASGAPLDRHTGFGLKQCGFSYCGMRRPRVPGPQSTKAWATPLACYRQKLFSQVAIRRFAHARHLKAVDDRRRGILEK